MYTIYIIEFKLNDTADAALEQIKEKKYYEKFLGDSRDILLIGAAFSKQTRQIEEYKTENCNG